MIDSAEQDEELMDEVVVAMLMSDLMLAPIPPQRAIADDGFHRNDALSLTVQSSLQGKEIGIVCDYAVTVTLQRQARDETDQHSFKALWAKVLAILKSPPAGLAIYSQLSHLTFSDIEASSEAEADGNDYQRSVTFDAYMSKA